MLYLKYKIRRGGFPHENKKRCNDLNSGINKVLWLGMQIKMVCMK